VLVVDDEPAIRFLCRVNLELDGYRVIEAASLDEARAALEDETVAVVLLDLHVGLERGDILLEEIRRREQRIAVVVVSGSCEVDAGMDADAVLSKPFLITDLMTSVRMLAGAGVPQ
jgi:DNA-binding response OmpR family regulator